ncbi:DUF6455 family protein [Sedimentitalea sp. HM32M-2]|uniref:DUF6455 family protein n=1 Tax=Sedimentitalea sp. HM32M-2 TaxID=3351566 RepID=UPI00363FCFEA
MRVLGNLMHHVRLATRMAMVTRVDPVALYKSGDLRQDEWADMVQRCRDCGWAGECPDWLDGHGDAGDAPETCPNRGRFRDLRRRAGERQTEDA